MSTDTDEYLKELTRGMSVHYSKLQSHQKLIDQLYDLTIKTADLAQASKASLEQQKISIAAMSKNFTEDTANLRKETKLTIEKLTNDIKVLKNNVSTLSQTASTLDTRMTNISDKLKKLNSEELSSNIKKLQKEVKYNMEYAEKRFGTLEEIKDSVARITRVQEEFERKSKLRDEETDYQFRKINSQLASLNTRLENLESLPNQFKEFDKKLDQILNFKL
jgi:chromosome segregation ATPase